MEPRGSVKTKIVLVSLTPFFGGGEVYYARLCELLREDFEISALIASEQLAAKIGWVGRVEVLRGASGLRRLEEARHLLRELVRSRCIDLVHLNGQAEANLVPACRRLRVPCVITRHTDLRLQSGALKRALYRRNAARADGVVCVSRTVAEQHEAFVAAENLHLIPHWVQVDNITRRENSGPFTVLFAGRLEEEKGVREMLEAARGLPEVRFVLVGDGPMRSEAERSGPENVKALGFREDVASLFASVDLLVNPSHSEGSSLVVLEAMAAGVPCLVSDIPVLREIVKDGQAGAVFACGDASRLAEAIEALRRDPGERGRLIDEGLRMVTEEHSPERIGARYRELFERLAKDPTLRSAQDGAPGLPQAS